MSSSTRETLRKLGRRLAVLRKQRGLTQEQLAEKLEMLTPNYARIEQGRQNVTIDTLHRISIALRTEIGEFFKQ